MNRTMIAQDLTCRATALLLIAAILIVQTACIIPTPVAFIPVPEPGSGEVITFGDKTGARIKQNGWLIVNREYYYGRIRAAPSNTLVAIEKGKAKIPHGLGLEIITLRPNGFAWMGFLSGPPILAQIVAFPFICIPIPSQHPSRQHISLMPLLAGYSPRLIGFNPLRTSITTQITNGDLRDENMTLWRNEKSRDQAIAYWKNWVLHRLRQRFQQRPKMRGPDLRFDHYHYWKIRRFVEAELNRIEQLPRE